MMICKTVAIRFSPSNMRTLHVQRDVYQTQLQICQETIVHLRTRYVDHARDPGKDNIIIIVRKHTTSANDRYHDFPYSILCRKHTKT